MSYDKLLRSGFDDLEKPANTGLRFLLLRINLRAMSGTPFVKNSDSFPADLVGAGKGTTRQVLISDRDAPHFALRRFIMEPGGGMPKHTNTVEHEQYVLKGRANVGIGESVFNVKAGDVVYIPKGEPHWYEADAQEGFEFLCIVPNQEDVIQLCEEPAC